MRHLKLYEEYSAYSVDDLKSYAIYLRDLYSGINDMASDSGVYCDLNQFAREGVINNYLYQRDGMDVKILVLNGYIKDIKMFADSMDINIDIQTFEDFTLANKRDAGIDTITESHSINDESPEFTEIRRKENNKLHSVLEKCGIGYWVVFSVNLVDTNEEYIIDGDVKDIAYVWISIGNSASILNEEEFKAFTELAKFGYDMSIRVNRAGTIAVNISRELILE